MRQEKAYHKQCGEGAACPLCTPKTPETHHADVVCDWQSVGPGLDRIPSSMFHPARTWHSRVELLLERNKNGYIIITNDKKTNKLFFTLAP